MKRVNAFISDDNFQYLTSLSSTLSEHIRFAVEAYVHKLRQEETRLARSARASASKKLDINPFFPNSIGVIKSIEKLRRGEEENG